jgi:hypothetical protein
VLGLRRDSVEIALKLVRVAQMMIGEWRVYKQFRGPRPMEDVT